MSDTFYCNGTEMDTPNAKRNKKADKARKNFEKTGGKSSRHVRVQEGFLSAPRGSLQIEKKGHK